MNTPSAIRHVALVAVAIAASVAVAEEKRTYRCYTITRPPKIDGILDDEVWNLLPVSNSFRNLLDGNFSEKQTYIRLGWDNAHLYIAVHCDEPDMKLISANMRDGDALWTEDSIEIFLQPEPSASYFQFGVNSLGAKVGAERAIGMTGFEAKGRHGSDFYSLEIKMPFTLFGKVPRPGEVWRGNIDRNVWAGGKVYSCWAPLQGSFHDAANFGRFIFDSQPASVELSRHSDASDNTYRNALLSRIDEAVKKAHEYESDLTYGLQLSAYRTEAEVLRQQAEQFRRIQAKASTASLKDLAAGARSAQEFSKKLHDFRYRVLITRLFDESETATKK